MLYEELPPPPALAPYVECFWVGRADAAPPFRPREALVPDGTTELMLNVGGPCSRSDFGWRGSRHSCGCRRAR